MRSTSSTTVTHNLHHNTSTTLVITTRRVRGGGHKAKLRLMVSKTDLGRGTGRFFETAGPSCEHELYCSAAAVASHRETPACHVLLLQWKRSVTCHANNQEPC